MGDGLGCVYGSGTHGKPRRGAQGYRSVDPLPDVGGRALQTACPACPASDYVVWVEGRSGFFNAVGSTRGGGGTLEEPEQSNSWRWVRVVAHFAKLLT